MKLYKYHGSATLKDWDLPALEANLERLGELIKVAAAEAIEHTLTSDEWDFGFPAEWGDHNGHRGTAPDDPMLMTVGVPLGELDLTTVEFAVSLRDVVAEIIEERVSPSTGKISKKESLGPLRLAQGFRALADMLESKIET